MYGFHPYIGTISGPYIPYNPYLVATLDIQWRLYYYITFTAIHMILVNRLLCPCNGMTRFNLYPGWLLCTDCTECTDLKLFQCTDEIRTFLAPMYG